MALEGGENGSVFGFGLYQGIGFAPVGVGADRMGGRGRPKEVGAHRCPRAHRFPCGGAGSGGVGSGGVGRNRHGGMGFNPRGHKGRRMIQNTAGQSPKFKFFEELGQGFPMVGFP